MTVLIAITLVGYTNNTICSGGYAGTAKDGAGMTHGRVESE